MWGSLCKENMVSSHQPWMMHTNTALKTTGWKFPNYNSSQISEKFGNFRALNNWLIYSVLLKHKYRQPRLCRQAILTSVPKKIMAL